MKKHRHKGPKQTRVTRNSIKQKQQIEFVIQEETNKDLKSPLSQIDSGRTVMFQGKVALPHNVLMKEPQSYREAASVKNSHHLGIKIPRPNKLHSNAVPFGYTRKEWNKQLQKLK